MKSEPPNAENIPGSKSPETDKTAYWAGLAAGLGPGCLLFIYTFFSQGDVLLGVLLLSVLFSALVLTIIHRTRKIGKIMLLMCFAGIVYPIGLLASPLLAVVLTLFKKTRRFGLGLLIGNVLTWLILFSICALNPNAWH